jgi:hypothetical protein
MQPYTIIWQICTIISILKLVLRYQLLLIGHNIFICTNKTPPSWKSTYLWLHIRCSWLEFDTIGIKPDVSEERWGRNTSITSLLFAQTDVLTNQQFFPSFRRMFWLVLLRFNFLLNWRPYVNESLQVNDSVVNSWRILINP